MKRDRPGFAALSRWPRRGFALLLALGVLAVLMIVAFGVAALSMAGRARTGLSQARAQALWEESAAALRALRRWDAEGRPNTLTIRYPLESVHAGDGAAAANADEQAARPYAQATVTRGWPGEPRYARIGLAHAEGDVWIEAETQLATRGQVRLRRQALYLCRAGDWALRALAAASFVG